MKAGFNRTSGCYEIRSISGVQRYHQAFINYGSHDNQRLLLEYGFVSSCNPHSVIYVEEGSLQKFGRAPPGAPASICSSIFLCSQICSVKFYGGMKAWRRR